jgi:epoxyqueuosine reductase
MAGLGWIGKHSLLLNRKYGSWFFLGVVVTDLELEPDAPVKDYCGECTRCVDACPTNAILPGKLVDASRCISYLTIENRDARIPEEFLGRMQNQVFGCDICQEVCPWNHNAHEHSEPWLSPRPGLLDMKRQDWLDLDEERFDSLFEGSAVKRAKYSGLRRNLDFL